MLWKKIAHKGLSIHRLLQYMYDGMKDQDRDVLIAHNLPSFDLSEITNAYLQNDVYRKQGKGITTWTHEILSFSPKDSEYLDNDKLEAIAQEYIERRNPNALIYCAAHMDSEHKHLHFAISATEYRSKKSLRMDNKEFNALRFGLEKWQKKTFPELKNSIVFDNREKRKPRGKVAAAEREFQANRRLGNKKSNKEKLSKKLQNIYDRSRSVEAFLANVKKSGLEIYFRNDKAAGIMGNKKYRFSTLGIDKSMFIALNRLSERDSEYATLDRSKSSERER